MADLITHFPQLRTSYFKITSLETSDYNCIAWACGRADRQLWPPPHCKRALVHQWPFDFKYTTSTDALIKLFKYYGYVICSTGDLDDGLEKVAIYELGSANAKHAARQLPSGRWTSKCGPDVDIEHELHGLEGKIYGAPTVFLSRVIEELDNATSGDLKD